MAKIIKKEEANIVWTDDPNFVKKSNKVASIEMIPSEHLLSIRLEKKGRGGKTVTVLHDLPMGSEDYFKKLVKKIKRSCGSGGTFKGESIEVQGEHKDSLSKFLNDLGFKTKFTGG